MVQCCDEIYIEIKIIFYREKKIKNINNETGIFFLSSVSA